MPRRIRRKELKRPDEFVTLTHRALEYARENERAVTLVAVAVVLLGALALGVRAYRSWQDRRAGEAYGRAYQEFAAGHFEQAAQAFAQVSSLWPGSRYGELALVYLGDGYVELGKDADAKASFQQLRDRTGEETLQQIARYNLGLLEKKGGDRVAAAQHLRAAAGMQGPLRGAAWLALAEMQRSSGESLAGELDSAPDGLPAELRQYAEEQILQSAGPGSGGK